MKLEEAIKHNEALCKELDIPERAKQRESVRLGIEALKFLIWQREHHDVSPSLLLPGETEE